MATLPSTSTSQSSSQLVKSYSNGTQWYRLYADGWCEQGGYFMCDWSHYDVNFLYPFKQQVISFVSSDDTPWPSCYIFRESDVTLKGFRISIDASGVPDSFNYGRITKVSYYACGY